ncbi:TRAP transporter small permease [Azospirillum picis]|uniref:TRAP transporter small permease protein n=1 Tax=Azospirillum picis TaxID=488438 RepID=A0ABU0MUB1_9PROT|nr:TRAP transporter small permease [Azospirillum picis]MBP2303289.1 TRAP-type C4-dicarboxylate transport system permease small subunit [Azospirillum picis]MDQ0537087.1 TRAP-type C4-dicarboxylate transport system permease small subunit [Azospirillum picis]
MSDHDPTIVRPDPTPRVPLALEEVLVAVTMAVVALITFVNVVVRYLTDVSFAFTEEYSIALMVILTFLGASAAVVKDRHIRITFVTDKLSPANRHRAEQFAMLCMAAMYGLLVVYGAWATWDDYRFEVTSPALGLPQWIYTICLPVLSLAVLARTVGRMIRIHRGTEPLETGHFPEEEP